MQCAQIFRRIDGVEYRRLFFHSGYAILESSTNVLRPGGIIVQHIMQGTKPVSLYTIVPAKCAVRIAVKCRTALYCDIFLMPFSEKMCFQVPGRR